MSKLAFNWFVGTALALNVAVVALRWAADDELRWFNVAAIALLALSLWLRNWSRL